MAKAKAKKRADWDEYFILAENLLVLSPRGFEMNIARMDNHGQD
jgi:hypothetical protein